MRSDTYPEGGREWLEECEETYPSPFVTIPDGLPAGMVDDAPTIPMMPVAPPRRAG